MTVTIHCDMGERFGAQRPEADLRLAIDRRTLTIRFKAQHAVRDHRLLGFEAQPNWLHPEEGAISALEFASAVHNSGLSTNGPRTPTPPRSRWR